MCWLYDCFIFVCSQDLALLHIGFHESGIEKAGRFQAVHYRRQNCTVQLAPVLSLLVLLMQNYLCAGPGFCCLFELISEQYFLGFFLLFWWWS